ncbi:uncharacterized protein MYCFIDRAFT_174323 [Pseudocercospora fijiensis CIRAD86]|uniref:Uncharacterized protein n=1 Tax=Pseudocercospora fijiensis (strain CIRAD86) TaxID=383855 RepID=M3B056_PSEFD|nr:uncharacterized protein MYCFIDRAFT_174323 [Pseudocercospora fijiensis CIRAD86]EME82783.1 hypothetical protein MYCFIDRAFT_174323 [Pseudocercospora fijiensis CIRAD86]
MYCVEAFPRQETAAGTQQTLRRASLSRPLFRKQLSRTSFTFSCPPLEQQWLIMALEMDDGLPTFEPIGPAPVISDAERLHARQIQPDNPEMAKAEALCLAGDVAWLLNRAPASRPSPSISRC